MEGDLSEDLLNFAVVPYAGTWIEIRGSIVSSGDVKVVPYAGTWIENFMQSFISTYFRIVLYGGITAVFLRFYRQMSRALYH